MLPRFSHLDVGINIGDSHTNECDDSENESVVNCDADVEACEAQLLDNLMKLAEEDNISHTKKQQNQLLQLTVAAIALDIDEQQCIWKFAEDDNTNSDICAHEFAHIEQCLSLPAVHLADDLSKPEWMRVERVKEQFNEDEDMLFVLDQHATMLAEMCVMWQGKLCGTPCLWSMSQHWGPLPKKLAAAASRRHDSVANGSSVVVVDDDDDEYEDSSDGDDGELLDTIEDVALLDEYNGKSIRDELSLNMSFWT
ncbi:hypothetical protein EV702DRAFT_1193479 [Suillus placidus]|uniref:Uncharacterized protein n=1 Tax=Suillus placidus TaxID=48579 RepID=A0A9P7A2J0_9AGAM|nr:hypothetical protein EV702DRAFT_1193479 [Suillus placidus]